MACEYLHFSDLLFLFHYFFLFQYGITRYVKLDSAMWTCLGHIKYQ